jgi:hypothetical protein
MHGIRTQEKREKFLLSLVETGGNVSASCGLAGIKRRTAYDWRSDDPEFAAEWDEAVNVGLDALESEARRRAFEGIEEPVFYKGEICGHIRRYSDSLIMFMLKAYRPQFRDRVLIDVNAVDAEIERRLAAMAQRGEAPVIGETENGPVN